MAKDPNRRRRRRRRLLVLAALGGAGWYLWSRCAAEPDDVELPRRPFAADDAGPPVAVNGAPRVPVAVSPPVVEVPAEPEAPMVEAPPVAPVAALTEVPAEPATPAPDAVPQADTPPVAPRPLFAVPEAVPDAVDVPAPDPAPGAGASALPDGSAPGPDYTIKGNASSKLFHPPSSPYYGRTKAEVWFRTSEEAREAGFTEYTPRRRAAR